MSSAQKDNPTSSKATPCGASHRQRQHHLPVVLVAAQPLLERPHGIFWPAGGQWQGRRGWGGQWWLGRERRREETQLGETQPRAAATSWTGDGWVLGRRGNRCQSVCRRGYVTATEERHCTICSPLAPRRQECVCPPHRSRTPPPTRRSWCLIRSRRAARSTHCRERRCVHWQSGNRRQIREFDVWLPRTLLQVHLHQSSDGLSGSTSRHQTKIRLWYFSAFFSLPTTFFVSVTQRVRLISQGPISATTVADGETPDTLLRPDVLCTRTFDENWSFLSLFWETNTIISWNSIRFVFFCKIKDFQHVAQVQLRSAGL